MGDHDSVTPMFPGLLLSETFPPTAGVEVKKLPTTPENANRSDSQTPTWSPQTASPASQSSDATTTVRFTPPLDSRQVSPVSSPPDDGSGAVSAPVDSRRPSPVLSRLEDGDTFSVIVDRNLVEAPTQQTENRKKAAPARVTATAVGSTPTSIGDERTIAQPAPVDGNAVPQPVLARGGVLVDGTTALAPPSAETTPGAPNVPSVTPTIKSKRLEASKPLRAKVGPSKKSSDGRPLTPRQPAGTVIHRKSRSRKSSRRKEHRSNVPPGVSKGKRPTQPVRGGKRRGVRKPGDEVSSKSESQEDSVSSPAASSKAWKGWGDLEEGGTKASIPPADFTYAIPAAPSPKAEDAREVGPDDHGLVLPCAPSDEEKDCYLKSGRALLLIAGYMAFLFLHIGMWLFTLASPYFYWFALPTIFTLVYFVCYMIVALPALGHDLDTEMHADIVRRGLEKEYYPTVDVFLPVCKEPLALLANTWTYVSKMKYPNLTVYVLDDGGQDDVRKLAATFGFQYIRRDNRPELKKAGNLRFAFARTSGEACAIFDADFCPRSDFLRETVPYLLDPSIGIVQSPQFFRWRKEQTWTERGAGASQEFFYRFEQINRDAFGGSVCVGSCALYRREAVEPFGGVVAIEHSEDMFTGFKMVDLGYKIKYLPICMAMGICPDEPRTYFMQQYRWCKGTMALVFERDFWRSKVSFVQKLCFLNGLMYYISTALFIFLGPLPLLLLVWIRADRLLWFHVGFCVPSAIFTTMVIPGWAQSFKGATMVQRMWRAIACFRVQIIQSFAHVHAIKDGLLGISAPWAPSGGGATRSSSKAYDSSVRLLLVWNVFSAALVAGGAIFRMTVLPWYNFVPAVALVLTTTLLSFSTLYYY